MKKLMLWVITLTIWSGASIQAQDIAGTWQGTLQAGKGLRTVLKISKTDDGGWSAMFYSIDQGPDGMAIPSITLQESTVKFSMPAINGSYEGKLSPDGASITGTWTQNNSSHPLNLQRATKETEWKADSSPHSAQFVMVDTNIKLEVLDWGGTGRSLVFLAGLGNTAHAFDKFAPELTAKYHVYGITRRGFGLSSAPTPANNNYSADRLADDVLAVLDALKINRPVLVGHSIAGEELSSIGSRHPEKVAGLIYLDAGYSYAFYDHVHGNMQIDSIDVKKKLEQFLSGDVKDQKQFLNDLQTSMSQLEKDVQETQKQIASMPALPPRQGPGPAIPMAIIAGEQKYTEIHVPVLAIFAVPHNLGPMLNGPMLKDNPTAQAAMKASDLATTSAQANAFEAGVPSARVVRLPNADHFVFNSNEADVLREMNAFLSTLP
ncbi:MAG TPA: alpha/beta hydrolase [Edaphobacter sp.]|nr:alpha/beta hydrolase [Edaphobacter sp.]